MKSLLAIERRQKIVDIIQEKKKVLVQELAVDFFVTEETIRRDLEKLENQGILKRTYGGAIINQGTNADMPLSVREISNKEAKMKIAERVSNIIEDGDTLMLDSSSTAFYVAKCIKRSNKKITLITNSLKVLIELQDIDNINIIVSGGKFRASAKSFIGKWSQSVIENYYVNKAIICCNGMDIERGVMDSNEEEATIKKFMAKSADKVFLVVDSLKFNKRSFVKIMDFEDVDYLYTDEPLTRNWQRVLEENDVKVEICN